MAPRGRKCALVDTQARKSHSFATKGKRLEWIREKLNEKHPGEFTSDGTVNAYWSQWLNSADSKAKGPLWEKFAAFMKPFELRDLDDSDTDDSAADAAAGDPAADDPAVVAVDAAAGLSAAGQSAASVGADGAAGPTADLLAPEHADEPVVLDDAANELAPADPRADHPPGYRDIYKKGDEVQHELSMAKAKAEKAKLKATKLEERRKETESWQAFVRREQDKTFTNKENIAMFNRIQEYTATTEQECTQAVQERDDSDAEVAKWNKLAEQPETGLKYSAFKSDDGSHDGDFDGFNLHRKELSGIEHAANHENICEKMKTKVDEIFAQDIVEKMYAGVTYDFRKRYSAAVTEVYCIEVIGWTTNRETMKHLEKQLIKITQERIRWHNQLEQRSEGSVYDEDAHLEVESQNKDSHGGAGTRQGHNRWELYIRWSGRRRPRAQSPQRRVSRGF